jgi:hypothetical protein
MSSVVGELVNFILEANTFHSKQFVKWGQMFQTTPVFSVQAEIKYLKEYRI